ncbi:MAG: serine/threonine-protein kinase [Pseudomonadota bacterium]
MSDNNAGATDSGPLSPGRVLGDRFTLKSFISAGGMGAVWCAEDRLFPFPDHDYVALKVISDEFKSHPAAMDVVREEAAKSKTLSHPNIVRIFDYVDDKSSPFIYMEYLDGGTLRDWMRDNPAIDSRPLADIHWIVDGIAEALAYAHSKGVIHCDIKPTNIFLTKSNEVKLIDFGISKAQRVDDDLFDKTVTTMSVDAKNLPYSPVEFFRNEPASPESDVYSFACVVYELLTGTHPFGGRSSDEALSAELSPEKPKGLNGGQWKALQSGLNLFRSNREGDTRVIARALEPTKASRSGAGKIPLPLIGGATALLAAASIGVLMLIQQPPKGDQGSGELGNNHSQSTPGQGSLQQSSQTPPQTDPASCTISGNYPAAPAICDLSDWAARYPGTPDGARLEVNNLNGALDIRITNSIDAFQNNACAFVLHINTFGEARIVEPVRFDPACRTAADVPLTRATASPSIPMGPPLVRLAQIKPYISAPNDAPIVLSLVEVKPGANDDPDADPWELIIPEDYWTSANCDGTPCTEQTFSEATSISVIEPRPIQADDALDMLRQAAALGRIQTVTLSVISGN